MNVWKMFTVEMFKSRKSKSEKVFCSSLELQIAEGILPHRSALGFPGLAGGFTFTIYGRYIFMKQYNQICGLPKLQIIKTKHCSFRQVMFFFYLMDFAWVN